MMRRSSREPTCRLTAATMDLARKASGRTPRSRDLPESLQRDRVLPSLIEYRPEYLTADGADVTDWTAILLDVIGAARIQPWLSCPISPSSIRTCTSGI